MTTSRMHASRAAVVALLLVLVAPMQACGVFNVRLESFSERLAGGYATATFVRELAGNLLENGNIDAAEAAAVQARADELRAALDIAAEWFQAGNAGADSKLAATIGALNALADELRGRQ